MLFQSQRKKHYMLMESVRSQQEELELLQALE